MSQIVQVAPPRRTPKNRGPALKGIAPGAGGTTTVAFGSTSNGRHKKAPKKRKHPKTTNQLDCWNAFAPNHLPLPRAVGEYTVTRGTTQIKTTDKLIIVGTWMTSDGAGATYGQNWTSVVGLGCDDLSKKPTETAWTPYVMPMLQDGLGKNSQVLPSACSCQIMNANALQETSGMLYIGKMKVQPQYDGNDTVTGKQIADNFVSYMAPRLCAAAKLALRGIQVDAHPLNMSLLADFTRINSRFAGDETTVWPSGLIPAGFTPIVIFNPNAVELNLLVCHEYRTRFELFNPACASHKYHPPSTDIDWAAMVRRAAELGSGALDIAEVVAKSGFLKRVIGGAFM